MKANENISNRRTQRTPHRNTIYLSVYKIVKDKGYIFCCHLHQPIKATSGYDGGFMGQRYKKSAKIL